MIIKRNFTKLKCLCLAALFVLILPEIGAQGFLHADGKRIVDGAGENVLLRGIGTGNWMLMEGYMMQTSGVAGTQHEFRNKLKETIGVEKTDSFFNAWLDYHFTRTDVDSMKVWGFNSVRVAMHYKWFTPPIEEEPVEGEITWIDKGFVMMDSLLDWCADNEMYLILDLHGAPGGQGKNADISDYDSTKPSLWESQANKDKTIALWRKLAERFSDEIWIGGYDLLNETNWTFPEGNNSQMRELFVAITNTIREVDKNHLIFIEGNSFANDHSGLKPPWDDNFAYSFHKYWSGTGPDDLNWIINLRNAYNVPLWLGESGENSNAWYTDMIALSEKQNIGWSWWPVKKSGINNVLSVTFNKSYEDLINYWKNPTPSKKPNAEDAFQAVLDWAENHKIENCKVRYDVIDAMIRQPHTDEVIPYKKHELTKPIFFSDFDYGKSGIAYADTYIANYGGAWTGWNNGWGLRNDGVDIEVCTDQGAPNNGFNVGWTDDAEWMQYSLVSDSAAVYSLSLRHASGSSGSKVHLEVNGTDVTGTLSLSGTGGWQSWRTTTFEDVIIPKGDVKLRMVIDKGGSNLNHFLLDNPKDVSGVNFQIVSAETSEDGNQIFVTVNKELTAINPDIAKEEFELLVNGLARSIKTVRISESSSYKLIVEMDGAIYSDNTVSLNFKGNSVESSEQTLNEISNLNVRKNLQESLRIAGTLQAEDFFINNGLALEDCTDSGGGKNTGYANTGDYLVYQVHVTKSGEYKLDYRVATERSNAELVFQVGEGTSYTSLDTIRFKSTGGWQKWQTQSADVYLKEGYYNVRLLIKQGEHNLNWFRLIYTGTPVEKNMIEQEIKVYPNPASDILWVDLRGMTNDNFSVQVFNLKGELIKTKKLKNDRFPLDIYELNKGIYLLKVQGSEWQRIMKFSKQ